MKKILSLIFLTTLFFLSFDNVSASTYIQGVVKSSSGIYKSATTNESERLYNDIGGKISLYSPEAVEVVGENGNFYQIRFLYTGFLYTGYILKSNIATKTYVTDDAYEADLVARGFPSEYAARLSILHAIHPNWTFSPSFTGNEKDGMDFYVAVDGEASVIARNLIDSKNTSLRSTADGAYKNGQWIGLSGANWFAASRQTIAFYLDPRNFLDESHIFMFENLGYNSASQTRDAVDKIIGGSFMKNSFTCIEGANMCEIGIHHFADTFMKTGIDKNVSPVHLASRVLQEQGSNGSVLSLGLGYNGQYIGYYNFFNIGASGLTDYDCIINGFNMAVSKNWNNQFASIYDGANTIANYYIGRGQSTRYYQKFNTIVPSYYGNQYMQNVQAPYTEAYTTYTGYYRSYATQEEWNNAYYDFLIPIYRNMGEPTTLDTSKNGDATLKMLTVSSCELNPSFQSSADTYECYLQDDIKEVDVAAFATNNLATLNYNTHVTLNDSDTEIQIIVTAANGSTQIYKVLVHKIETDGYSPDEILNGIGLKSNGETAYNVELGSDISNIANSIKNSYHFATVRMANSQGAELNDGAVKTGDTITITNSGQTSFYRIIVYGDTTGDSVIDIRDLLVIQKHLVKASTLSDVYLASADINKDGLVDIRDLLLEQKYLLGAYSISQS